MAFDLDQPWCLDGRVALRPEPFGALLYHFGTRRLSFLKEPLLLAVVQRLADHPSARLACEAAGVSAQAMPTYERALGTLASSEMIRVRDERDFLG
jgi:mycofactocin biosynthesis protein MftB